MLTPHRLLVALFLLAVLLLLFGRSLQPGYALAPTDLIFSSPFYADLKPPEFTQAANGLLFDQVYQFVPWRWLTWESLRQGRLPLWNPNSYSGTPFIATLQSAVFYPLNLLLNLILPFSMTFTWSALLRLWLAGLGTHALALEYGLRRKSAILAGLSFMLCAFLVTWLGHPHTNVLALLPFTILLTEQLLRANHLRQCGIRIIGLGLILGMAILGGHPASIVSLMLTVVIYTGVRLFQLHRERALIRWSRSLPALAMAFGLAAMLSAVQVLPFLEWLPLSNEIGSRSAMPFRWFDSSVFWHLLTLPLAVMPNLFNNPSWTDHPYWSFLARRGNYNEYALYVGVIAFLAMLAGLAQRRRPALPSPLVAWLIIGAIGLGRHLPVPIIGWINHLPLIGLGDSGRSQVVYMLAVALLGAWSLDLMQGDHAVAEAIRKRFGRLCLSVGLFGLVIMLGANLILPTLRARVIAIGRAQVEHEYALRTTHTHPISYYYAEVEQMVAGLLAAYRPSNIAMYSSAGIALLAWAATAARRRRPAILSGQCYAGILVGLAAGDLLLFAHGYNPTIAAKDLYPEPPVVAALHQDHNLFRVTALRQDLLPDAQIMHQLSDIRGLDYPTRWYREYMGVVPDRLPWLAYGEILASADSPLLRVLNLKYILSARRDELARLKDIAQITQYGNMYLARVAKPVPRAFLVHQAALLPSDAELLQLLSTEPERVYGRVLLRDGPDERRGMAALAGAGPVAASRSDSVTNLSYQDQSSSWQVDASSPGFLFVSDAYYPGWQATVDGTSTPILRANHAFRALFIPPGSHHVSFHYAPASIIWGLRLSLSALAGALVVLVLLVAVPTATPLTAPPTP